MPGGTIVVLIFSVGFIFQRDYCYCSSNNVYTMCSAVTLHLPYLCLSVSSASHQSWRGECFVYNMYSHTGRIDRKIEFPLPDEKTRRRIFQIHTKKMTLAEDLDLEEYITAKDDLSGADIKVRVAESGGGGLVAYTSCMSTILGFGGSLNTCTLCTCMYMS